MLNYLMKQVVRFAVILQVVNNSVVSAADGDIDSDIDCQFRLIIPEGCFRQIIDPISNETKLQPVDLTVLAFQFKNDDQVSEKNGVEDFCETKELLEFPEDCIAQNTSFRFSNHFRCPRPDAIELDGPILWIEATTYPKHQSSYRRDTAGLIMECISNNALQLRSDEKIQYSGIGVSFGRGTPERNWGTRSEYNLLTDGSLFQSGSQSWIKMQIPRSLTAGTLVGNSGNYTLYYFHRDDDDTDKMERVARNFEIIINSPESTAQEDLLYNKRELKFKILPKEVRCEALSNEDLYVASIGGDNPAETRGLSKCLAKESSCDKKVVGKLCVQNRPCASLVRSELTQDGVIFCSDRNSSVTDFYFTDLTVFMNRADPHSVDGKSLISLQEDDKQPVWQYTEPDYDETTGMEVSTPIEDIKVYDQQIKDLECHYIPYILVPAIVWKIRFSNQSVIEVHRSALGSKDIVDEQIEDRNIRVSMNIKSAKFSFQFTKEMVEINCGASYWDSDEYVNSFRNITVLSSQVPTFSEAMNDQESLTVDAGHDFKLTCQPVFSAPAATFEWEFEGKPIMSNENCINIKDDPATGSSVAKICNAGKSHTGTFTCRARNFLGSNEMRFSVTVTPSTSGWIFFGVACVLIILLVPIILVLYRVYLTQRSRLSALEIAAFENGNERMIRKSGQAHENAQFLPYNKDYEIDWKHFSLDDDNVLGEGAFGIVLKGKVNEKLVAAKTVRPTAEKCAVLALLAELKIMIYLGTHDNIVQLVGACTSMLRQGKPYVFVEFCDNGDLHSFLLKSRPFFVDHTKNGGTPTAVASQTSEASTPLYSNVADSDNVNINSDSLKNESVRITMTRAVPNLYENAKNADAPTRISTLDLLRWAMDIAGGMEYLESKKVIHGDLAARNVLLTSSLQVKITDFGLSRQLQKNYTQYVKKQQTMLPWRWMAIESLYNMIFTSKSDVWAFGVTLWEMFSLADIPFPEHNWTQEFMERLKNGLRPPKPLYATDNMYKMITSCWLQEPDQRPSFAQLKHTFAHISPNPNAGQRNYITIE